MHYFDHSATTPPHKEVVRTVSEVMSQVYGNPSSLHRIGVEAERLITKARQVIASCLKVHPETVYFTSGGTESNNMAIKGIAFQYQNRGKHLITSEIEHPSVYECFKQLESYGFDVTYLPVDATGAVKLEDLKAAVREDTILVSIMHVNNEMGRIQPIAEIGRFLKAYPKLYFHVDGVQAFGKVPLRLNESGIDLLSLSAHKIEGPKGAGVLYCRKGVQLSPLLAGGGQERGFRSGTENVPLIVGMAKAVRMAAERQAQTAEYLYKLRAKLLACLSEIPNVRVHGSANEREMAPHIVHFSVPGMKSEVLLHALEQRDIYVSTRSACSSKDDRPSRVLLAMGLDRNEAASGLRVSLAASHTEADIDYLCRQLKEVIQQIGNIHNKEGMKE